MPSTLLHLVSEQTMQNLLPLLALRPGRVVQIRSGDIRFHRNVEQLKNAVEAVSRSGAYPDFAPEFFEIVIDETSPSADSTRRHLSEALTLWPDSVINLTGGTKPMSIGAYLAADARGIPVLYCDTQERCFASMNIRSPIPPLPSFDEITSSLNVETMMAAQGVSSIGWKSQKPDQRLVSFGEHALSCRLNEEEELLEFARQLREDFKPAGKFLSAKNFALRNQTPMTRMQAPGVTAFLRAAADLGDVIETSDGFRFRPEMTNRACQKAVDLLEGTWLELAVFALLSRNPDFGDLQWGLKPGNQDAAGFGETDIVCVDRKFTSLALISCKSTPPKLEHLEALRQRKETLGGRFSRATLCVAHVSKPEKERLSIWSKALGINLLAGKQIIDAFAPGPLDGTRQQPRNVHGCPTARQTLLHYLTFLT